ncbi:MAG: response regulator [Desulfovibrio sp.]
MAEDNEVNTLCLRTLMERCGNTVLHAGNGQEALDILGREAVGLVLMDVQMPVMDGLEATRPSVGCCPTWRQTILFKTAASFS